MKLQLNKEWFERRIPSNEDYEVGAGVSTEPPEQIEELSNSSLEKASVETLAFGALIQYLRRDRRLSIEQLASAAKLSVEEIVKIEFDQQYLPHPQSVHQLATYFDLPPRELFKLSSGDSLQDDHLREAAYRFAAHISNTTELTSQERGALSEFVSFLGRRNLD